MNGQPVICFGQQPCGIFPRRFLYAKIVTARRLQAEIGGRIVFFYHDSDHDPRETRTIVADPRTGAARMLNFSFENKLQRKYSPLYLKRISRGWQEETARRLEPLVEVGLVEMFRQVRADNVADFCLLMYQRMGLLDGIEIVRSSDPQVRNAACEVPDFFVDLSYEGEIVRARRAFNCFVLHEGGDSFVELPLCNFRKSQISPTRDTRLRWMQSVIQCTHYVSGAGEQAYLNLDDAPGVQFVKRDPIDRSDEAYVPPLIPFPPSGRKGPG